jgi:hypothetical protein
MAQKNNTPVKDINYYQKEILEVILLRSWSNGFVFSPWLHGDFLEVCLLLKI